MWQLNVWSNSDSLGFANEVRLPQASCTRLQDRSLPLLLVHVQAKKVNRRLGPRLNLFIDRTLEHKVLVFL